MGEEVNRMQNKGDLWTVKFSLSKWVIQVKLPDHFQENSQSS